MKALLNETIDEAVHTSNINQATNSLLTNLFDELEYEMDDDMDEFEDEDEEGRGMAGKGWNS